MSDIRPIRPHEITDLTFVELIPNEVEISKEKAFDRMLTGNYVHARNSAGILFRIYLGGHTEYDWRQ